MKYYEKLSIYVKITFFIYYLEHIILKIYKNLKKNVKNNIN